MPEIEERAASIGCEIRSITSDRETDVKIYDRVQKHSLSMNLFRFCRNTRIITNF